MTNLKMSGWCATASSDNVELADPAGYHARCTRATLSSDGSLTVCPCDCHDDEPYCPVCGQSGVVGEHDRDDCDRRIATELLSRENHLVQINWKKVSETVARPVAGANPRADAQRPTSGRRKASSGKPCACGCGGVTGGTFCMGHDARLKSRLRHAALEGDTQAYAEILARGWDKSAGDLTGVPTRARLEAEAMMSAYDDGRIHDWLEARNESRREDAA